MPTLDQRHRFSDAEISAVYKIALRRDIRHFSTVTSRKNNSRACWRRRVKRRAWDSACSPGVSSRITDANLRRAIHAQIEKERIRTARALGERAS